MKVLVTGGSGFIGAWILKRLLGQGEEVRVFDRSPDRRIVRGIVGAEADDLDWCVGDIASEEDVFAAFEGCDAVVHLAGVLTPACQADPVRGAQINLIGTLNVFEAAKREKLGFVTYASSAGVFGPENGDTPRPTTHYGAFKLACEGSARAYWADSHIASVGFRPFIVYGPGRESGISAGPTLACRAVARGEPYTIGFSGAAGFIHVDDVAAAFVEALVRKPAGAHVFNLAGETLPVEAIAAEIRRQAPSARLEVSGPPLPIYPEIGADDIAAVLPGLPRTGIAEGIAGTLAHYRI